MLTEENVSKEVTEITVKEALLNLPNSNFTPMQLIGASLAEVDRHPAFWQRISVLTMFLTLTKFYRLEDGSTFQYKKTSEITDDERLVLREMLEGYLDISALLENGNLNVLLQRAKDLDLTWQHICLMDRIYSMDDYMSFLRFVKKGNAPERLSEALVMHLQQLEDGNY